MPSKTNLRKTPTTVAVSVEQLQTLAAQVELAMQYNSGSIESHRALVGVLVEAQNAVLDLHKVDPDSIVLVRTPCDPDDADDWVHPLPPSPKSHHNAPEGTSDVAAASIGKHAEIQRAAVLEAIVQSGPNGVTDAEIETITYLRAQSVSPRRGELVTIGEVVDSGRRRNTPRGRPAAVWVAKRYVN